MSIQIKKYTSKKTGKESKKYYACVFDVVSGTTIWGKGRTKRSEAIRDEVDIMEELEKGSPKTKGNMKFKDVAELWLNSMKNTYAESTWKGYKGYYKAQLSPVFDNIEVKKITPARIQKFKNTLSEKYKPATVNKSMNLMSMMMDYAIKPLHVLKYNPCADIKRDKVAQPNHVTWDEDLIGYFLSLDMVIESDYYEMLVLSFTTALRPGEVCGISVDSLRGDNILSLSRGLNKYGNVTEMKTQESHRPLMLDNFVYKLLENKLEKKKFQKESYAKEYLKGNRPTTYKENDFLFTYEDGTPISPNSYSRAFRNIIISHNDKLKEIESIKGNIPAGEYYLPKIRLYDGRHSFATNTLLNGRENAKIVSEIMGSKVETIMKNYVHIGKTMHHATLSKYSGKIFKFEEYRKKDVE